MLDKYAGDLDTSLLFVSTFTLSLHVLCPSTPSFWTVLGGFVLCRLHNFHCPNHSIASVKPLRPHERPTPSNIATKRFVWWVRPAGTRHECFLQSCQSSVNPLCQFGCHIIRGLHRGIGETVDPVLQTGLDVGEHRRSREGTPGQVRGASEVGTTLHHGVATRFVATCTPPFRHRPYRLSLGSRPFRCGGDTGRSLASALRFTPYSRGCDDLERLPIPDALIHFTPEGLPWVKEFARVACRLAGAMVKALLRASNGRKARSPVTKSPRTCASIFGRENHADQVVKIRLRQALLHEAFEPRVLEADPLFASPLPEDTAASAGFWLLENSTDFSAATAVAAVFSEFQWPSHHHSTTALIRLRDTYTECFRAPEFDRSPLA
jgi:hypothetical protein